MTGSTIHDFCKKKAFEVSYALFRVAGAAPRKSFSEHIEAQALDLLKAAAAHDYRSAGTTLAAIEYFLRLGAEGGLVSPSNSQIIINEANALNAAMVAAFGNAATVAALDLEGIFSSHEEIHQESSKENPKEEKAEKHKEFQVEEVQKRDEETQSSYFPEPEEVFDMKREEMVFTSAGDQKIDVQSNAATIAEYVTKMRQSTIFEKIREFDNCRLRDIQEFLPDISERTIRYDLQSLVEQGLIERIGSGGPGSYYRVRQAYPQTA